METQEKFICKYCGKICKNSNSLRNHERLCKSNPNRQILTSNFIKYNENVRKGIIKGKNQFIKAKELGLPKPEISQETRNKIAKSKSGENSSSKRPEVRKKISESMKKVAKEKPNIYSISKIHSRVKHFWYNGYYIDGLWELVVVNFLDANGIDWIKPRKSFEYEWNNGIHNYYPDFYLPAYDIYIEVKGYETERDLAKYKVVKNLIVLKDKEIKQIKNNKFDINKLLAVSSIG